MIAKKKSASGRAFAPLSKLELILGGCVAFLCGLGLSLAVALFAHV